MSDSFIQPPANTGVGPLVDTEQLTVNAQSVQRQRIVIADPTSATAKAAVAQSGNSDAQAATTFALQEASFSLLYNGTTFDRQRAAVGTVGIAAANSEGTKASYSIAGLVTPVATATDIVIINGSVSKTIRVTRVEVSVAATAAGIVDVLLVRRSTADTAGSSTTPTPILYDTTDGAATSVVTVYTANPTLGTSLGAIRATKVGITAASGQNLFTWAFTERNTKGVILRGVAQGLAINLNGDALIAGEVVAYSIEWTEE